MSSLFHLFDAFIHPHSRALLASEHVHTAAPQVYVFAVIFAQAVSDHRSDPDACLSMLVVKIFPGSLFSWVWPLRLYLITYLYNGLKLPVLLSSRWHLTWLRHGYPIESVILVQKLSALFHDGCDHKPKYHNLPQFWLCQMVENEWERYFHLLPNYVPLIQHWFPTICKMLSNILWFHYQLISPFFSNPFEFPPVSQEFPPLGEAESRAADRSLVASGGTSKDS